MENKRLLLRQPTLNIRDEKLMQTSRKGLIKKGHTMNPTMIKPRLIFKVFCKYQAVTFLESGHLMMECDSMHSAIEKDKRNVAIYTLNDPRNIFKMSGSRRGKKKTIRIMPKN